MYGQQCHLNVINISEFFEGIAQFKVPMDVGKYVSYIPYLPPTHCQNRFSPLNLSKNLASDYSHPPSDSFGIFPRLLALGLALSFSKV
jgi:hypothetical protein